ncbi:MAG: hypothetical protein IKX91_05655 [Firmicutes bacterium]|nr:hypothetical protein [Bacillota bacterium]
MKLYPLVTETDDPKALETEYKAAREIGKVRIGETALFFRVRLKTFYVPYSDVKRFFRRVHEIPLRTESFGGDLMIENLVVCGEGDKELIQVQLPGAKAAKILFEELRERMPDTPFGKPVDPQ